MAALMAHLLLHAASGFVFRELRLIQLHDVARLAPRLTQEDWQRILTWNPWWAFPSLVLAEHYYGAIAPRIVMVRARECCPAILRRISSQQVLSDVSLSRLWVDAFPGLEWARSAREAASYIAHRVAPSTQLRSDRRRQLESEPGLSERDRARLTQRRRIKRI